MKSFEQVVKELNKKGIYISSLVQINSGKAWSISLRKGFNFTGGYGDGRTIEAATKDALKRLRMVMTEKDWQKVIKEQETAKPKRLKRKKLSKMNK